MGLLNPCPLLYPIPTLSVKTCFTSFDLGTSGSRSEESLVFQFRNQTVRGNEL